MGAPAQLGGGGLGGDVGAGERCMRMGAELAREATPPPAVGMMPRKAWDGGRGCKRNWGGSLPRRGSQPHSGAMSMPSSPLDVPRGYPPGISTWAPEGAGLGGCPGPLGAPGGMDGRTDGQSSG